MRVVRAAIVWVAAALMVALTPVLDAAAQDRPNIEVVPQIGHSGSVLSVAFSPDGRQVLSGGGDLKLWDVASGALLRTFQGHSDEVWSVAFSPDGRQVLSGGDGTLRLWDAVSGALLRNFNGHSGAVRSVAFSPDGRLVLSGSYDKTVKLWDAASGALLHTFQGHSGAVWSVAFSPDGRQALSGSVDKTLKLWNASSGALLRSFQGHLDPVYSVAFSPDGRQALSGSNDKTLNLWDLASGALLRTFRGCSSMVWSVAFSPDGQQVLAGSGDKTLHLWDAASGALLRTFQEHSDWVLSVTFSPNGRQVLSGSVDNTLKLWDVATGAALHTFKGHSGAVQSVAFSPDGRQVLSGSIVNTLTMWDAVGGTPLRTFKGHSGAVWPVAFSPDGRQVLSGSEDRTLKLWDAASGALLRTFQGHSGGVWSVAFSPDGRQVLSGSEDRTLKLWDAASGALLRTLYDQSGKEIRSAVFSPDGRQVLSGSYDETLKLWDTASGALLRTFQGHSDWVWSVAFSPDGRQVLSGSRDSTLKLWDVATGALLRTFAGHSNRVRSVAFSPDGRQVLSGSYDKTLKLWDVASGALLRTFQANMDGVWSVAFSSNGRQILSGHSDGTTRVWNVVTGEALVSFLATTEGDWLAISPEGFFSGVPRASDKMVSVVRGLEVTTISQVHQSLFNPDLVRAALAGDPDGEVRDAAKIINLDKVVASGPAPTVLLTAPSQSSTDIVAITAHITDRGKGIGRIEWRVNGITAAVAAKPTGSGPSYTVTRELALDAGDNTIEVVAYNASNLVASLPARTTVTFMEPANKARPTLHILAIGINKYVDGGWAQLGKKAGGFGPLRLAVVDATAFGDNMKTAAAGLYSEVRVTLALDKNARRENLHKLVDRMAKEIHPRDSFILFAAAHGHAEGGRFYLIPQDYQSGPPGTLAKRAIGQDELQDWLANRIKARKAIVLLDTCESGSLIAGYKRSRVETAASEASVGRLHEATGRPVLTATAEGQLAGEGPIAGTHEGHGYFTWAVLDALRYADANGNGLIELSELAAHVQSVLPKVAAGIVVRSGGSAQAADKQAARFGSRGEDFAVARRLQ